MSKQLVGAGLTLAYLLLIGMIAGVGYLGLQDADVLRRDAQSIAETQWRDVELADEAFAYSNRNSRINTQLTVIDDPVEIQSLLRQRTENSNQIAAVIAVLRTRVGSRREQLLLGTVISTRAAYIASYQKLSDLLLQGRRKEARRVLASQSLPLLSQYHSAWSEFVRFQSEEMNESLATGAAHYAAARTKTAALLSIALVFAFGIAIYEMRTIMREIRRRELADAHSQQLNQQLELKVQQRTADLKRSNDVLSGEVVERKAVEEKLRSETAFLEAQADSTVDGILVVDENGKKILQNRRFKELFRIPQNILDNDDDQATFEYVVSKTPNPREFREYVEYLYAHRELTSRDEIEFKDGMVLDRYTAPVLGKDKKYYGRIWVFRDITERKRNEEVVRRLSVAVDQSPVSVVITDLHANIIYVNRKFVECTGYSYEEVLGKNPRILKSGYTAPDDYKALWQTIAAGRQWKGEFQNRKKNGDLYWEYAVIQPILDDRGAISHFLALKEDITERRNMEAQLQRAQKLEAIGHLAAGIAHEINTPMQFIGDNTRFVQQAWPPFNELVRLCFSAHQSAAQTDMGQLMRHLDSCDVADLQFQQSEIPKAIEQSLDGIARVSQIVQAMKQFSHPGSENKELLNINEAIEATITIARNEWKYVATVESDLSASVGQLPCYVSEFNQVILNLLINAAHAIAQVVGDGSHGKGNITVRSRREPGWVEISITDNGCGIPTEIRPRIFDPFFTTKEVGKGTGQGLALAHAIVVKKHGGRIWFETQVGQGTTFFVRLPAAADDAEATVLEKVETKS